MIDKITRLRPGLVQGGEAYDFPSQITVVLGALLAAGLLRVPFYAPVFENVPIRSKYEHVRRLGLQVGPLVVGLVRRLAHTYYSRAMLLFAPNTGARRNLADNGIPADKISSLLYATWGVDIDVFSDRRDGLEPDAGPHGVLFVGRLTESKGVGYLLGAFARVVRTLPDARLLIAGSGEMAQHIRQLAGDYGISSSVRLLGTVLNRDLPPLFRAVRATATPSITTPRWTEQVGMVNVQSMACGTPVVSTMSGAIPEFVLDGRTGMLVPERDEAALAEAMTRLLTDDELHSRLARGARAYALERFDAHRNVAAAENLLRQRTRAVTGGRLGADLAADVSATAVAGPSQGSSSVADERGRGGEQ